MAAMGMFPADRGGGVVDHRADRGKAGRRGTPSRRVARLARRHGKAYAVRVNESARCPSA
jgi:hypothetical protein